MTKNGRIAFIGLGAMGGALLRRLLAVKLAPPEEIVAFDIDRSRITAAANELCVRPAASSAEAARAQLVILAVKPQQVDAAMAEIGPVLGAKQTLVSIAAGITISRLRTLIKEPKVGIVRVMPNTPALVGAGMTGLAFDTGISPAVRKKVSAIFSAAGEVVELDEPLMDALTGLSGSGPAYVFLVIEALADGGVAAGLPRPVAQKLALQTVFGAAALLKETGQHPAAAKDMVASPGGTTIAGLGVLEKSAFRSSLIQAVVRAAERSRELSGK